MSLSYSQCGKNGLKSFYDEINVKQCMHEAQRKMEPTVSCKHQIGETLQPTHVTAFWMQSSWREMQEGQLSLSVPRMLHLPRRLNGSTDLFQFKYIGCMLWIHIKMLQCSANCRAYLCKAQFKKTYLCKHRPKAWKTLFFCINCIHESQLNLNLI